MSKNLSINNFSYNLPDDRIAQYPLEKRTDAKLLVYTKGRIQEGIFYNLDAHIPEGALLVMNTTKVIPARIYLTTTAGHEIEIFCLEPHAPFTEKEKALHTHMQTCVWSCFIGNNKKWKEGETHVRGEHGTELLVSRIGKEENGTFLVEFSWNAKVTFSEVLKAFGTLPLPPYMHRASNTEDYDRYQTVLAKDEGAVAAPTASLHMDQELLDRLHTTKKVHLTTVVLHVGAGTFLPMKSEDIAEHVMHGEAFTVTYECIQKIYAQIKNKQTIVALGTTSLRTLESLPYLLDENGIVRESIGQWEWQEKKATLPIETILENIMTYMQKNTLHELRGTTHIMIAPGFPFRIVDGLITNFHQPQSTLLVLVSAFVGEAWKDIYTYAENNNFRFLSYGDSSLLWRP